LLKTCLTVCKYSPETLKMLQQIKLTLPAIIESKYSHYFFSYLSKSKLAE